MKIKVCDTTTNQFSWLVAKCEGVEAYMPKFQFKNELMIKNPFGEPLKCPDWTTDFSRCNSIAKENLILTDIGPEYHGSMYQIFISTISNKQSIPIGKGLTPEISILRCYIIYKLGKEVEVPDNLI